MSRSTAEKFSLPGIIIRQIVDRCHVADSRKHVIRYLISRMSDGYRTWMDIPREQRRAIMRLAFKRHEQNRDLYFRVMRGRI